MSTEGVIKIYYLEELDDGMCIITEDDIVTYAGSVMDCPDQFMSDDVEMYVSPSDYEEMRRFAEPRH